ncbi:MAG TPA: NAD(P)-dependent oxidoreductase [Nocardioidaceae bacterium]|nr:NAD(P)-dependent oxidoreductase [Nocardioidaceae bacterium]
MRVLIADAFPESHRARLVERGHDVVFDPDTTADQLPERIAGFEAIVVRSTRVTADTLNKADALRVVIRAGSGTNTIDAETATERGIHVCNVPGRNAVAVAELAFGLLLALDRRIPDNVQDLREGEWNKKRYAKARGILGRNIGVVGLGQIGLAFAERSAAFGAQVHAVAKPDRDPEKAARADAVGVTYVEDLPTLARSCDVLSFHLPAAAGTRGLVDRDLLAEVRPGAIILNTSRGEIIDEDALIEAMDAKGIRAGLDVYVDEPGRSTGQIDSRITRHPNVYGTHHIGASTEQAQQAIAEEVVRMLDAYQSGEVLHCVNLDPETVG